MGKETQLPSRFKPEDKVNLVFSENQILNNCEITAVKFHKDKVYYDVAVLILDGYTIIESIDSAFVSDEKNESII